MSYPNPTRKITRVSWALLCAEFSTEDNPNRFTHRVALFLLCHTSGVHRNHLLTQEQAEGLCLHSPAAGGSDLSCCKEACSSTQRNSSTQRSSSPCSGCLSQPLAQLSAPHSCPPDPHLTTAQQGGQQVTQPWAATSCPATAAGKSRGSSLGRWEGAGKFGWLWAHRECLLLDN